MDEPSEGLAPVMVLELSHIIAQLKESVARKIPECTISKEALKRRLLVTPTLCSKLISKVEDYA